MKTNQLRKIRQIVLASAALIIWISCGCGGKANSSAGTLTPAELSTQAESMAAEVDANQKIADFEQDTDDVTGVLGLADQNVQLELAASDSASALGSASGPGVVLPRAFFPAEVVPQGVIATDQVAINYYACGATDNTCRIKALDIPIQFPARHYLVSAEIQASLTYSSFLTGTVGNQNLSARYIPAFSAQPANFPAGITGPRSAGFGRGSTPPGFPSGMTQAQNPPSGNPPSGNPPSGNPPSGNPPSGNPPSGNPPSGNPPSGNLPSESVSSGSAAYVSSDFTITRVVRGEANPIITIGTGLIYEDQQTNPFYTFTWTTTGFPSSVTVCNEDVIEPLQVDDYVLVDSISRIRETTKTYPDGVSAYYYRSAIFDGGTVYVDSFRRSREGGTISVQAVLDTGSTPDCPLDDTGTISVIRTFPVPSHLAEGVTAPVEETAVIDKQGLTENVSFTLTYSNGQILTRSWQRQVQSPTSCSAWETASSPSSLVTQVTGPLYLGGDLDFTVTHDVLGLSLTGTQTQTDGSYTEFEVDRYQNAEVSSLQAKQYQADHTLTAEMAVKLRGDSQGQGQITVFAGGNTQAIIPHFTCNGEDFWSSNDDPSDRHELGSGKLKKANADI